MTIDCTPNCPRCHTPLSLVDNELSPVIWCCDQHFSETGIESIFLTLIDIDHVIRDAAAWDDIVAEHPKFET